MDDLTSARLLAGLSVLEAANALGVTRQTVRLWETGKIRTPRYALELLQFRAGFLPHPGWDEWRFRDGRLWCPTGQGFEPGDVYSIPRLRSALESTYSELQRLRPKPEPVQLALALPHIPAWLRHAR